MRIAREFQTKAVLRDLCNECRVKWLETGLSTGRKALSTPLYRLSTNRLQVNQHFALSIHSSENWKMSQAFNTSESYNNNENSFNKNDRSFNTNSFNTTTYNYTTSDDRSEILAWLSPLEPRVRHRDIGSRRVDSIGAWLLETEEFKRWHKGSREDGSYHPTLFCDGNSGVGKSYIM